MVTMTYFQRLAFGYDADDLIKFAQISASLVDPLEILLELAGLEDGFHASQFA